MHGITCIHSSFARLMSVSFDSIDQPRSGIIIRSLTVLDKMKVVVLQQNEIGKRMASKSLHQLVFLQV